MTEGVRVLGASDGMQHVRDEVRVLGGREREFLPGATAAYGKNVETISDEVMDHLKTYGWPGNVRELQATLDAAVIRADGRTLELIDVRQTRAQDNENGSKGGRPSTLERQQILDALQRSGGNRSVAARLLRIGRATLYRHLERLETLDGDQER
jgi:two-component system response regulator HydG